MPWGRHGLDQSAKKLGIYTLTQWRLNNGENINCLPTISIDKSAIEMKRLIQIGISALLIAIISAIAFIFIYYPDQQITRFKA